MAVLRHDHLRLDPRAVLALAAERLQREVHACFDRNWVLEGPVPSDPGLLVMADTDPMADGKSKRIALARVAKLCSRGPRRGDVRGGRARPDAVDARLEPFVRPLIDVLLTLRGMRHRERSVVAGGVPEVVAHDVDEDQVTR